MAGRGSIWIRACPGSCPQHGQQHLEPLPGLYCMRNISRHYHHLAGRCVHFLAADAEFGLSVQYLYHGIKRGRMLAKPLAGIKGEQGDGACLVLDKGAADH